MHPALIAYPPTIPTKDGRELTVQFLGREAFCVKCKRESTTVGYRDRKARRVWPTCLRCARIADGLIIEGTDFRPASDQD